MWCVKLHVFYYRPSKLSIFLKRDQYKIRKNINNTFFYIRIWCDQNINLKKKI